MPTTHRQMVNRAIHGFYMLGKGLLLAVAGVVAVLAALVLAGTMPRLFGKQSFVVLGGSMEPSIRVGSLAVVSPVPAETLQSGHVITYVVRTGDLVTHRIVEVIEDERGRAYVTKGDANAYADNEPVQTENVVGKVSYAVPVAGYAVYAMTQPVVRQLVMGGALLLALVVTFGNSLAGDQRRSEPPAAVLDTAGVRGGT
jgi:signal peptidase I